MQRLTELAVAIFIAEIIERLLYGLLSPTPPPPLPPSLSNKDMEEGLESVLIDSALVLRFLDYTRAANELEDITAEIRSNLIRQD